MPPWDQQERRVGLGCALLPSAELVAQALKAGVRHLDTARDYGTEAWVAQALKAARVPRSDVFVTSKCNGWPEKHIDASLNALETSYVDLYLMHWPMLDDARRKMQWQQLEQIRTCGKARFVGVANADVPMLTQLVDVWKCRLDAVQCEVNVYCQNDDVLAFCTERGIPVIGYGAVAGNVWFQELRKPYGRCDLPRMLKHPEVVAAAEMAGCTPGQALIAWGLQRGALQIPKASTIERVLENCASIDVLLPEAATRRLTALNDPARSTSVALDMVLRRRRRTSSPAWLAECLRWLRRWYS